MCNIALSVGFSLRHCYSMFNVCDLVIVVFYVIIIDIVFIIVIRVCCEFCSCICYIHSHIVALDIVLVAVHVMFVIVPFDYHCV